MNVTVSIGGGQKMALTGAVLVYRGGTDAFAAWHPAKPGPVGGGTASGRSRIADHGIPANVGGRAGNLHSAGDLAGERFGPNLRAVGLVDSGSISHALLR